MLTRLKKVSRNQTALYYTAAITFIIFIFLEFSWASVITCIFIFISLVQLVHIKLNKVQERGLISLLPRTLQIHLLDRSIFDLLCDIWYIPKISLYIKAFFKPFVQNISPEEAASALQELPDSAKRAIMTKGLINFLPNFVQSAIMPQQQQQLEGERNAIHIKQRNIDEDDEDQDSLGSTNTTKSTKCQGDDDIYDKNNNIEYQNYHNLQNKNQIIQNNHLQNQNKFLYESHLYINPYSENNQTSILSLSEQYNNNQNTLYPQNKYQRKQNNPLKEINIQEESPKERNIPLKRIYKNSQHEFSFNNNLFMLSQNEPNTFIKSHDKSSKHIKWSNQSPHQSSSSDDENMMNQSSKNFYEIFHNRGTLSDEEFPKTKLIASSFTQLASSSEDVPITPTGNNSLKPQIADKWDKLDKFRNKVSENYKKFLQTKLSQQNLNNNNTILNNNKQNKPSIIHSARSILSLFHNIMELKKMGNIQNIDNKKLIKILLYSSAFMGAQVMTSRRARKWMVNTSLMFLYVLSFVLTTGTLGVIFLKYHQEQQQKQVQNKKNSNDNNDIHNKKSESS